MRELVGLYVYVWVVIVALVGLLAVQCARRRMNKSEQMIGHQTTKIITRIQVVERDTGGVYDIAETKTETYSECELNIDAHSKRSKINANSKMQDQFPHELKSILFDFALDSKC